MVRNLEAQARAIWPQELILFRRYDIPAGAKILDAGCGTGEITSRLADLYPAAKILGIDIIDAHLELARSRYARFVPRLSFDRQSVFELPMADGAFDLTVCRHVLHSIPHADQVIGELKRVTRPGGYLHLIPEDYGMLQFQRATVDPNDFWYRAAREFERSTNTDLFIGRGSYGILRKLGLQAVAVNYIVVDTVRVPREVFAAIIEAWRDGYADSIGELTSVTASAAVKYFDQMLANIRDPFGYAVWFVPVVSAKIPS